MRVIPVLDLKDGLVVHAVAGQRARYQPIKSVLVDTPEPLSVLCALREKLWCDEFYVADLNAIQGQGNHYGLIARLAAEPGVKLLVDAGANTAQEVQTLLSLGVRQVVLGTETLPHWQAACAVLEAVRVGQLVLSLDMQAGRVLSRSQELAFLHPLDALRRAEEAGFRSVILLDLARVGTRQGPDIALLTQARQTCPRLELIAGGGVRGVVDLAALRDAGVDGVLVATALHSGDITPEAIKREA